MLVGHLVKMSKYEKVPINGLDNYKEKVENSPIKFNFRFLLKRSIDILWTYLSPKVNPETLE